MANIKTPQTGNRFVNNICSNTKTDFIEITEDKLENILMKYITILKKTKNWITPFSIFLTILITILTADFKKEFLGIDQFIWSAIFYISLFISGLWLIADLYNLLKYNKKSKIECLIKTIKNN